MKSYFTYAFLLHIAANKKGSILLPKNSTQYHVYMCMTVILKPDLRYSKTCVKQPLSKRQKIGFQDQLLLNAGQKYCRMLQGEHSAIFPTFIKVPFVIKIFGLYLSGRFTQVLL